MTGQSEPVPPSPPPDETSDVSINIERPKVQTVHKLGTVLGVFVPCLQSVLGIILFIRFTW